MLTVWILYLYCSVLLLFTKPLTSKPLPSSLRAHSPETAGPPRKNTTKTFSIRITSLINSWQIEHTGAGITGKMMIYLQTSQLQLTPNPATKGKQNPRKYLMTSCFSMTTDIIYDPLCNDTSIIHWKAVLKDIVNKHSWFANRKPEILLWKLRGWG